MVAALAVSMYLCESCDSSCVVGVLTMIKQVHEVYTLGALVYLGIKMKAVCNLSKSYNHLWICYCQSSIHTYIPRTYTTKLLCEYGPLQYPYIYKLHLPIS